MHLKASLFIICLLAVLSPPVFAWFHENEINIPPTPAFPNIQINGVWNNASSYNDFLSFNTGNVAGGGMANGTASYIISTNGTFIAAINGSNGNIDYSGSDADVVIQSAINNMPNGGLVFFKAGTYVLSNPSQGVRMFNVTGVNGISFIGEGYGTVLEMKENGEVFEIDDVSGGSISNFRFEGERYDDENHGIVVRDSQFYTVNNNWFHNMGDEAINYGRVNQSSIFNNFFNHSTGAGGGGAISLQASNQTIISMNTLYNPSRNGIHIEQTASTKASHFLTISNNVIVNSSWYGIALSSTGFENRNNSDITIVGNVIVDAGKEGIRLAGSTGSTPLNIAVIGNTVQGGGNDPSGTQRAGITVTQAIQPTNTVAIGNIVKDYGTGSSNRRGIAGFDVYVGNTVTGSGDHGFFIGSNSTVIGNQCDNNGSFSGGGQRAGISVQGDFNVILGNTCQNTDLNNLMQIRGIQLASTSDNNIVIGNNVQDGGSSVANWLDDDGNNNQVHFNIGDIGLNDFINSTTCGMNEAFSAYDNATGYFTCSAGGAADNLGNHIGTQSLDLGGFNVTLDADGDFVMHLSNDDDVGFVHTTGTAPQLYLSKDGVNNDFGTTAQILFKGGNDINVLHNWATITSVVQDNTDGTEDTRYEISVQDDGNLDVALRLHGGGTPGRVDIDNGWPIWLDLGANLYWDNGGNTRTVASDSGGEDILTFVVDGQIPLRLFQGDVLIGGAIPSNGDSVIVLSNDNSPTSAVNNAAQIWADNSTNTKLYAMDEDGNQVLLTPHEFTHVERKAPNDWVTLQENAYIGKGVSVSWYEIIRTLEDLTGKTLIHEYDLPPDKVRNWDADQQANKIKHDDNRQKMIDEKNKLLVIISYYQSEISSGATDENYRDLLNQVLDEFNSIDIPEPYLTKDRPAWFDMKETRP